MKVYSVKKSNVPVLWLNKGFCVFVSVAVRKHGERADQAVHCRRAFPAGAAGMSAGGGCHGDATLPRQPDSGAGLLLPGTQSERLSENRGGRERKRVVKLLSHPEAVDPVQEPLCCVFNCRLFIY